VRRQQPRRPQRSGHPHRVRRAARRHTGVRAAGRAGRGQGAPRAAVVLPLTPAAERTRTMARVSPAVAAFVGGAVLATAVSALAQPGGADPGLNARATPAWLTVRVADAMGTDRTLTWVPTGSFASSAEVRVPRYPSSPIRGTGPRPLSLLAVRNEQVSAQLAIASGHALHHVAAHVGDLTAPGGFRIPGTSTQVRFVRYVPVERAATESEWSATLEQVSSPTEVSGDRDPDVVGDPLAEGASVDVPAYAAQ